MDFKGLLDDETLARIDQDAGLQQALALMAASGPSLMPQNLGSILLQGNQARDESRQVGLKNAMQRQELLQQRQRQQQDKNILGMISPTSAQQALAGGGGPTIANAEKLGQQPDKNRYLQAYTAALGGNRFDLAREIKTAMDVQFPKPTYEKVGKGEQLIDPTTGKVIAQGAEDLPTAVREYQYAQSQGYQGSFNDFQTQLKKAGTTVIGGFGNDRQLFQGEQDLRKEFKDTPTAKAFNEVKFAYDQVATALKNPSAANDLTAATKFMKILDPGSVVRESELGLAMSATGLFDRASNYYEFLKSGQRLTPSQREDFYRSATQLYNAALDPYVKTREQYQDIAKRYEFDPNRVLGDKAPDRMPITSIKPVLSPADAAREELERRRNQK